MQGVLRKKIDGSIPGGITQARGEVAAASRSRRIPVQYSSHWGMESQNRLLLKRTKQLHRDTRQARTHARRSPGPIPLE